MTLKDSWRRRTLREKCFLAAGFTLVACASFYVLLLQPVNAERIRLHVNIDALRSEAIQMKLAFQEIKRLKSHPGNSHMQDTPKNALASLRDSTKLAGLDNILFEKDSPGSFRASSPSANLAYLSELIDKAQEQGLTLEFCDIRALRKSGAVSFEVVFRANKIDMGS